MSTNSAIEWTDTTWNPIRGCSRVSEGCVHCYAERLAATRLRHQPAYAGLATMTPEGPRWTGEVRLDRATLVAPLRWRGPRRVFVNSMGDLFHESVNDRDVWAVFAVMASCPTLTFQVLTKRPGRARQILSGWHNPERVGDGSGFARMAAYREALGPLAFAEDGGPGVAAGHVLTPWPLPNVWIGTSIEDQATANERIPALLETPAAVRFVSAEPLLGPVDLTRLDVYPLGSPVGEWRDALTPARYYGPAGAIAVGLNWVIVGGESGPGARPMAPAWARGLRDHCAAAGVPFFFKQWGAWGPTPLDLALEDCADVRLDDVTGEPREYPHGEGLSRLGRKRNGRLLDGVEHNGFPA